MYINTSVYTEWIVSAIQDSAQDAGISLPAMLLVLYPLGDTLVSLGLA